MPKVIKEVKIFNYLDYRQYLKDFYGVQKAAHKGFSHRSFAEEAGVRSSGFFINVVSGKRNLTRPLILKFSKAIGHGKREAEYFENLVWFTQSKSLDEKNLYFERLGRFYTSKAYLVESDKHEYYSTWYYSAVRELLQFIDFKDDYSSLARALNPTIRSDQARKAVEILEALGLAKRDSKGFLRPSQNVITTGAEVKSLQVSNFQRSTLDLAREALDRHNPKVRDISTLTMSFSEETFNTIKQEIVTFRQRIANLVEHDDRPDRVYQLNLQFFPLSKLPQGKKGA